jgi:hypothetical protein
MGGSYSATKENSINLTHASYDDFNAQHPEQGISEG